MSVARKLTVLGAAALSAALLAPSAAQAAQGACGQPLPGPVGTTWPVARDGAQDASMDYLGTTSWRKDHATLRVGATAYPSIPNDPPLCVVSPTSTQFPAKVLEGFVVTRRVESVAGQLRRVDTFTNASNALKLLEASYYLSPTDEGHVVTTPSGDVVATDDEHWTVHKSFGASFGFLQWGDGGPGSRSPAIEEESTGNDTWVVDGANMHPATLRYTGIPVVPGATVRILQTTGLAAGQAQAERAARDGAAAFAGLTKAEAEQVVNWGPDPDGDGVAAKADDCPGVKGDNAAGCLDPKPPVAPTPPATPTPTPAPAPAPVVTGPAPTPPAPPVGAPRDTRAPKLTVTGLRGSIRQSTLRTGLAVRAGCDERCSVSATLQVRRKGARRLTTVMRTRATALSATPRTVKVKADRKALRRLARREVRVVVTAVDAAGNRRTTTRTVKLAT